jgi:hypothetical protein
MECDILSLSIRKEVVEMSMAAAKPAFIIRDNSEEDVRQQKKILAQKVSQGRTAMKGHMLTQPVAGCKTTALQAIITATYQATTNPEAVIAQCDKAAEKTAKRLSPR